MYSYVIIIYIRIYIYLSYYVHSFSWVTGVWKTIRQVVPVAKLSGPLAAPFFFCASWTDRAYSDDSTAKHTHTQKHPHTLSRFKSWHLTKKKKRKKSTNQNSQVRLQCECNKMSIFSFSNILSLKTWFLKFVNSHWLILVAKHVE